MKFLLPIVLVVFTVISCKQEMPKSLEAPATVETKKTYPAAMQSLFEAHGGLDTWNAKNTLMYRIVSEEGNQTHTVDLKSRKIRHDAPNYVLGFDGNKVWLKQDSTYFNPERARFSHNLMFYFYAMPFVLGDDGITYMEAPPLTYEGVTYPGVKISYEAGIGDAPEDNYIVYRHPETNQMKWLAYTVTYGKGVPSDRYSLIRYNHWTAVQGLQLPAKLEWYAYADGKIGEKRFERVFDNAFAKAQPPNPSLFEKPAEAIFAE